MGIRRVRAKDYLILICGGIVLALAITALVTGIVQ